MRVFWELVNLQDCAWEYHCQIIMKTILQEKETIHYCITIWFTNLILCLKLRKFQQQKQRWTRNGKNWRKFRRGTWQESEVKKRWSIDEARTTGAKVHFASLMHICHLKNAELEAKHQKYKGRVVLRGDIVKDESGSYAVFTGQGSSASQMTAAKVMDIISRLPGCAGPSSWRSICFYPGKKWKMLKSFWKFPNRSVQTFGFVYHDTNGLNHGPVWKTQVVSSWAKSVWSSFGRTVMGKAIWENPIRARLGKSSKLGMFLRTPPKRVILICVCWWNKIVRKETKRWSDVETTQQRSRFGRTNIFPWSCIPGMYSTTMWNKQRYCGQLQSHVWIANVRGENWKNYLTLQIFVFLRGPTIWKVMPRNVWNDIVSWQTGGLNQLYKVSTPCIDDHHFKEEELKSVGELSKVYSQIVLKCLYLARIGRPDVLWSVNKLARSITKWTKACDKRLNCLISCIHHTCEFQQCCFVGNTAKQCRLGTVWRLRFCWRSWGLRVLLRVEHCAFFGSHAFVAISWMCKKQTSV